MRWRSAGIDPGRPVLLLVDQFEEIFRSGPSAASDSEQEGKDGVKSARDEPGLFVNRILEATRTARFPIYVILTMRSEYIGWCDCFYGLPEAINASEFLTPRLTREQLEEAITGPASLFDVSVDEAVVNRILNAVGDKPDHLPLMQHALMRAWQLAPRGPSERAGPD